MSSSRDGRCIAGDTPATYLIFLKYLNSYAKTLKWGRNTIRKGEHELKSGCDFEDQFHLRGRKPAEHHLPNLLLDIKGIIEPRSQADPTFKSTRVYTPLTAESVRTRLLEDFDYEDSSLPCSRTLSNKINGLGYSLKK